MQDLLLIFVVLLVLLTTISTLGGSVYANDEKLYAEPFVISGANISGSSGGKSKQQHAAVPPSEGQCKACTDEVKPINKKKEAMSPAPPPPPPAPVVAPPEPFAPERGEFVVEGFDGDMYASF